MFKMAECPSSKYPVKKIVNHSTVPSGIIGKQAYHSNIKAIAKKIAAAQNP
jgi:hypothetical protein